MKAIKEWAKYLAIKIMRVLMRLLYIFPVKKNRAIFCSFNGGVYSCNPKYICEYMRNNNSRNWELIWAVKGDTSLDSFPQDVTTCKYHGLKYFYYLATSKVAVDNVGIISTYPRRKSQIFINTWHGGGCYKNVGIAEKAISKPHRLREMMSARNNSLYISSSKFFTENVLKGQFNYDGKVIECGMPRNDKLVKGNESVINAVKNKVKAYYGITEDTKILLYAPTWRYSDAGDLYDVDYAKVVESLKKRFGGKWLVLCRMHHYNKEANKTNNSNVISASDYPDMQELLLASDVLISDYSSSIWDYSFTFKPCFLFAVDLQEYITERGFVKDIMSWGFPVCENNEKLCEAIENFDEAAYKAAMINHQNDLESCESGEACKLVYEYICNFIDKE